VGSEVDSMVLNYSTFSTREATVSIFVTWVGSVLLGKFISIGAIVISFEFEAHARISCMLQTNRAKEPSVTPNTIHIMGPAE